MGHLDRQSYHPRHAEVPDSPESLGIVDNLNSIARVLKRNVVAEEHNIKRRLTKEEVNRRYRETVVQEAQYKSSDNSNYWAHTLDVFGRTHDEIEMLLVGRYQILDDATRRSDGQRGFSEELGIENPGY